ncbi:MAG: type II toxin-antitoxin system RelE/ParE family toxin [Phycisphaerales bacterium]|nr:MAG: type II toxin-antitoxin system RelE/ParE family toxin [Phycisphaerales bacterium]
MPPTEVILFKEDDDSVPLIEWLDGLPRKARTKCVAALHRLELLGHELRRPEADYLQDDIYELRVRLQSVNYRMLYFFHGRVAAVVSHGIEKERAVPAKEIDRAVERKRRFERRPEKHTFRPQGA